MKPKVHFLTQFLWPDGCPTGLYVEQVAQDLRKRGWDVVLVGGSGHYRHSPRPNPCVPMIRLPHFQGKRGNLPLVAAEYLAVFHAFQKYIHDHVRPGDVVVATTAPPSSLALASRIRSRGALSIYWIQDYYPELVRALWDYPPGIRNFIQPHWDDLIAGWDHVVKTASNLGYDGPNTTIIRNWPTLTLGGEFPAIPKTALYSGNFGYIHHVPSFLATCRKLADSGYQITVRGDGPGMAQMPAWIHKAAPLEDMETLRRSYWEAEIHLIAGHPKIQRAVFPSKIYNSLATGRKIVCTGFEGLLQEEWEQVQKLDWRTFLPMWNELLVKLTS